jgi:hypothetical protein
VEIDGYKKQPEKYRRCLFWPRASAKSTLRALLVPFSSSFQANFGEPFMDDLHALTSCTLRSPRSVSKARGSGDWVTGRFGTHASVCAIRHLYTVVPNIVVSFEAAKRLGRQIGYLASEDLQYPGCGLRRIFLLRTRVNKGERMRCWEKYWPRRGLRAHNGDYSKRRQKREVEGE